jgi:hypothetical protein
MTLLRGWHWLWEDGAGEVQVPPLRRYAPSFGMTGSRARRLARYSAAIAITRL